MACEIVPISAFASTNLNNKNNTYDDIGFRILRALGHPLVKVELAPEQIYENISIATELFSKYAGYTTEGLVFDTALYERDRGIRLDWLFSVGVPGRQSQDPQNTNNYIVENETKYVSTTNIPIEYFATNPYLSGSFDRGIFKGEVIRIKDFDPNSADSLLLSAYSQTTTVPTTAGQYVMTLNEGPQKLINLYDGDFIKTLEYTLPLSALGTETPIVSSNKPEQQIRLMPQGHARDQYMRLFDYDLMDYRKVVSVTNFLKGTSNGVGSLFTMESVLAQQSQYQYMLGKYGFDLLSYYTMRQWMGTRDKVLALNPSYSFDDRTQYFKLFPQPLLTNNMRYYAYLECKVERPIRDLLKEQWVYKYSLALCKQTLAHVRGKFGNITLFGGGGVQYAELMQQGTSEQEKLEEQLYTGSVAGLGDTDPIGFFLA